VKKTIALDKIIQSKRLKVRAGGLDKEHVADLAAAYEAGTDVPAPRVFEIKGLAGYYLTRGRHRLAALEQAGRAKVECEVKAGVFDDALSDAAQGDGEHGLRRTNKDKRQAVARFLEEHPDWSDRDIAAAAGVEHHLVADVRKVGESPTDGKKQREKPSVFTGLQKKLRGLIKEPLSPQTYDRWLEDVTQTAREMVEAFKKDGGLF